ncbi:MAG TPA: cytochrome c peroxidase [Cyclobacteriaceae bacterium]|nr:cytochrome c peroxidase [Cyclobacteriaceae bacterium]
MPDRTLLRYSCILLIVVVGGSCQEQELKLNSVGETYLDLPATRYEYTNFNDSSDAIATLGRVLFYDRQLSINNTISCASCHKQSSAFADNVRFSLGFEGKSTTRNSMPLQNIGFGGFLFFDQQKFSSSSFAPTSSSIAFIGGDHLFWDGRESVLEKLALQPVGNHVEMGITDVNALSKKLSGLPYYESLFNDAFGDPEINSEKIAASISTFVRSIRTNTTRFDQHVVSQFPGAALPSDLNAVELEGMMLFNDKYDCNGCHQVTSPNGYLFAGTFANIGLDAAYADNGLQNTTGKPEDAGKFKIPSLRNLSYTAPYMHDGRFKTLGDVMEHYSEGMANHPNLDPRLKGDNGQARSMNISDHEKEAIVAFLHTLNDPSIVSDPKFSNPFKTR